MFKYTSLWGTVFLSNPCKSWLQTGSYCVQDMKKRIFRDAKRITSGHRPYRQVETERELTNSRLFPISHFFFFVNVSWRAGSPLCELWLLSNSGPWSVRSMISLFLSGPTINKSDLCVLFLLLVGKYLCYNYFCHIYVKVNRFIKIYNTALFFYHLKTIAFMYCVSTWAHAPQASCSRHMATFRSQFSFLMRVPGIK